MWRDPQPVASSMGSRASRTATPRERNRMKDILVHLDGSARSGAVMAFAAGLARRCLAHLTAVYTLEFPALEFFAGPSDLVDLRFVDETIERLRERARDNAAKIEQE